jgi:hypothetical protein
MREERIVEVMLTDYVNLFVFRKTTTRVLEGLRSDLKNCKIHLDGEQDRSTQRITTQTCECSTLRMYF